MGQTQIGVQMYTLRDFCETPSDIASTLKKLKDMGFGAIQASASGFNTIDANELKTILDDTGMVCAATHSPLDKLKEIDAIVDYHATINCKLTAVGGHFPTGEDCTIENWRSFVNEFNAVAPKLAAKGLRIGYHNHNHEFIPFEMPVKPDRLLPYELLRDELDRSAWFELDTFWVQAGGACPAAWIKSFASRIPAIHVKDLTLTRDHQNKMCEVGSGNLNWPGILAAAKEAGVEWYLIERDNGDLDPFESLKISLEALKSWGLE